MSTTMSKTITYLGIELDIYFIHDKGYRGTRDSLNGIAGAGPPLEPDEPEEIIIEMITHKGEDILDLISNSMLEKIQHTLEEELSNEPDFD